MIFHLAFRNLFRNIRRTVAVLLTVAIGAGALFSFKGFINGILEDYRESTVHSHYGHGQINTLNYRETVYEKPWEHWIDNWREVDDFLTEQPEVEHVFPRIGFSALLKNGDLSASGQGEGIVAEEESDFFHSLNIVEGEPLTTQKNGIILGKGLATALKVQPGDNVLLYVNSAKNKFNKKEFTVTGIFYTGAVDFDNRIFRVQLNDAQTLMKTNSIEKISIGLKEYTGWEKVSQAVEDRFPDLETAPFNELDKVYYQHSIDWLNTQFSVVQVIIIGIVLLGIFNTISTAILERKQEIGNLRANGESSFDVLRLVLTEGFLMGIIGSVLGIGLSFFILMTFLNHGIKMPPGPGLTNEMFISFKFNWKMLFQIFILNFSVVMLATILAGFKTVRMTIAKALRSH
ncbi:MAG: ABC transporter permease [Chlamydiota bacterium]|jgi:putative ABC transport system permease protein